MSESAPASLPEPVLDVVCLCAAWCGTCGEYAQTFQALQAGAPQYRYRWIDIEDEADLLGDIDVETFPTLMVATQGRVLFAGPVLPRLGDAQRLLQAQAERVQAWVGQGQAVPQPVLGLAPDQAEAFIALAQTL
jgi:thioredoxin 1